MVEVIYSQPRQQLVNGTEVASVDIGWNNLAAITSNSKGFQPFLIIGTPVKAINNYYNKQKSQLLSFLKKNRKTLNCIQRLSTKRNLGDPMPVSGTSEAKRVKFSGRRPVKRGRYSSKADITFNADINGSCNIMQKVAPNT